MGQVTIQVDDSTLRALETVAAKAHITVSSWIRARIIQSLKSDWPQNYFALFGSLDDDDLIEPGEIPFEYDSEKEDL